jgi:hypothetical protein
MIIIKQQNKNKKRGAAHPKTTPHPKYTTMKNTIYEIIFKRANYHH